MYRIELVCLGHKKQISAKFESIDELKDAVSTNFAEHLKKSKFEVTTSVEFILTFENEESKKQELLVDINVIKAKNGQLFKINVKRIWNLCCACLCSFGIVSDRLPIECPGKDCGYQYCGKCIQSIKHCNSAENSKFYCMHCGYSCSQGPDYDPLLIDLLWKQLYAKYGVDLLETLSILPGAFKNDISCRITHLECLVQTLTTRALRMNLFSDALESEIERTNKLINNLKTIHDSIDQFISSERVDDSELNDFKRRYCEFLDNNNGKLGNFIEICETLSYHIRQNDFKNNFPSLNELLLKYEDLFNSSRTFDPKIIEVYKALENDLNRLINSNMPRKVGLIGNKNVGKSSTLNHLRQVIIEPNASNENIDLNETIISPMRSGKSTLCKLEFDHEYSDGTKVTFVDIEGAIDHNVHLKSGNYLDEIRKADCDLYLIVFDQECTEIHQTWKNYIEILLKRECWFVRNKADDLFLTAFKEDVGKDFDSSDDKIRNQYAEKVIQRIRATVSKDIHGNELSKPYLTFCSYQKNGVNQILSGTPYGKFDFDELINNIKNFVKRSPTDRLEKMAACAIAEVINTCFRRGYVFNVLKHKIFAGVAAVIPFLDLLPRYMGRESIRQAFGVNTRSRFMNWWKGETDEFKKYITDMKIEMYEGELQTSAFKKIVKFKPLDSKQQGLEKTLAALSKGVTAAGVVGVSLSDDVIRAAGVIAVNSIRAVSISLLVVGIVASAGLCAWAAVSNGKQMYNYLNRLSDDLIIVGFYTIKKIIQNNNQIQQSFQDNGIQ